MYKKEVEKKLMDILYEAYPSLKEMDINENSELINDLGIDSLGVSELVFDIEDEFDVMITDKDIETFKTIKNIVDYIDKQNIFYMENNL